MEIHMFLDGLHLFHDVLCQKLGQWGQFLTRCFVKHHHEAACLLQILYICPNQVLISLDSDYGYTIVAHICHNFSH